jgi:hypothetical protein
MHDIDMHSPADIESKTRLTAAEMIGFQHLCKIDTRSVGNGHRHLVRESLRKRLGELPESVRAALVREWDE